MAAMPDLTHKVILVCGPRDYPGGPFLSGRLPKYMRIQTFPAIIPSGLAESAKMFLLKACLCFSVDQTSAIANRKGEDAKILMSEQGPFTMTSHNSPVPKESDRVAIFKTLPLESDYSSIAEVVRDYAKLDKTFDIPSFETFKTSIAIV
jgi:hypothetical protein